MTKLTLTQFRLLYNAYNSNENSIRLTNRMQIKEAYNLVELMPDLFIVNRLDVADYVFHIKDLGSLLTILKYNSRHERCV
jgi:hypothetical protein